MKLPDMKMEIPIVAPAGGTVEGIRVSAGGDDRGGGRAYDH
jgi:biotin carboxyl carrier protein